MPAWLQSDNLVLLLESRLCMRVVAVVYPFGGYCGWWDCKYRIVNQVREIAVVWPVVVAKVSKIISSTWSLYLSVCLLSL